jgi:hypothetical protein
MLSFSVSSASWKHRSNRGKTLRTGTAPMHSRRWSHGLVSLWRECGAVRSRQPGGVAAFTVP